jgi:hypothetical protein
VPDWGGCCPRHGVASSDCWRSSRTRSAGLGALAPPCRLRGCGSQLQPGHRSASLTLHLKVGQRSRPPRPALRPVRPGAPRAHPQHLQQARRTARTHRVVSAPAPAAVRAGAGGGVTAPVPAPGGARRAGPDGTAGAVGAPHRQPLHPTFRSPDPQQQTPRSRRAPNQFWRPRAHREPRGWSVRPLPTAGVTAAVPGGSWGFPSPLLPFEDRLR